MKVCTFGKREMRVQLVVMRCSQHIKFLKKLDLMTFHGKFVEGLSIVQDSIRFISGIFGVVYIVGHKDVSGPSTSFA